MVKQPMVARQVRVPEKLWEDAKTAADGNDENISDVIRRELTRYVKENRATYSVETEGRISGDFTGTGAAEGRIGDQS